MKRQFTPVPRPRTRAIETSTFLTPFFGLIAFALLQPRSREVPRSTARRRERRSLLRLKRVTGARRSGHALRPPPLLSAAARWAGPLSHSVGPPVWLETQVPGSLSAA